MFVSKTTVGRRGRMVVAVEKDSASHNLQLEALAAAKRIPESYDR
jgi:hypothetical protein